MWTITERSFNCASQHHQETIFTIGNGYLSTRGATEEGFPNERRATLIRGVFDNIPVYFTELANAPDWLSLQVFLNGEKFSLATGCIHSYQSELDLRNGILIRSLKWQSPAGNTATLKFERFASLANEHLLCLRCLVLPEFDGEVEIHAALNGNKDNEGINHWRWLGQGLFKMKTGCNPAYLRICAELLEEIRAARLKSALGSGSKNARQVLQNLGIESLLNVITDGNSVERQTSAPDLFLYADDLLGVAPKQCIVVENAAASIEVTCVE